MHTRVETIASVVLASLYISPASAVAPERDPTPAEVIERAKPADWRPLDSDNTVYLELPGGRVVIEMAPEFAPHHVANIKALIREGYFDGLSINRVQDNYVAQWGDPEEGTGRARAIRMAKTSVSAEFTIPSSRVVEFALLTRVDGYAPEVGFSNSFPVARDPASGKTWLTHCYGTVGVGRDEDVGSGSGSTLYVIIGHAPRQLDRNITVVGRVRQGIELLSSLPRGTGTLGFYDKAAQRIPIRAVRVATDVPTAERSSLEVMRSGTDAFSKLVEAVRNRQDDWYKVPAGYVDLCNVPIPVRSHLLQ